MKATKIAMVLAVVIGVAALLLRQGGGADHILISDVVATPGMDGRIVVTMTFENRGAPDLVIAAASPEAAAMVHAPDSEGYPPLPAGAGYSFAMDGAHIVLADLVGEAAEGRLIPLTLTFVLAGEVKLKAKVKGPTMEGMQHGGMDHGAMHMVPVDAPEPALSIVAMADEDGWRIPVMTQNFTFSRDAADGPHEEGVGHGHLFVGGMKIGRVYGDVAAIGALPPGQHLVRVSLNTNDHRAYAVGGAPVTATATIVVD